MRSSVPSFPRRVGLDVFARYRRTQARLHDLTYLFWECTLRCNLSCRHCGSDCQRKAGVDDMPLEDFLGVLDDIGGSANPAKITLALTGGEPLVREDLEDCGRAFRERGFPWGMVTNGYDLTESRLAALVRAGLGSITISLDGLEDSHNWLRGRPDSFARAVEAIRHVTRVRGLVHDVVTCVNQKSFPELDAVKELLIGLGVKRWRLFNIFPKGRAKDNALLDVSGPQFVHILEFLEATRKEGRISPSYGCEGFLGDYEGRVRDGFYWCRAGIHIGSVLVDGSISACPSLRGDYIQGNIHQDRFTECWNTRFGVMRDRSWTRTGLCADCDAYRWCEGNGLHLRDQQSGGLLRCHLQMLENGLAEIRTGPGVVA